MFDDRLAILRKKTGKTKKEMAEILNLPYTTYLTYEADTRQPPSETLIKIADYYNVTVDYLLGRSDVKNVDTNLQAVCAYLGITEKAAIAIKDFSPIFPLNAFLSSEEKEELAQRLNLSDKAVKSIAVEDILANSCNALFEIGANIFYYQKEILGVILNEDDKKALQFAIENFKGTEEERRIKEFNIIKDLLKQHYSTEELKFKCSEIIADRKEKINSAIYRYANYSSNFMTAFADFLFSNSSYAPIFEILKEASETIFQVKYQTEIYTENFKDILK